jgi:hypothetical protein
MKQVTEKQIADAINYLMAGKMVARDVVWANPPITPQQYFLGKQAVLEKVTQVLPEDMPNALSRILGYTQVAQDDWVSNVYENVYPENTQIFWVEFATKDGESENVEESFYQVDMAAVTETANKNLLRLDLIGSFASGPPDSQVQATFFIRV